jgi:hypothetical protein
VKATLAVAALLLTSALAQASVSVRRSPADAKRIDVAIVREPLSSALRALQLYVPNQIELAAESDPLVTYRARGVMPIAALHAIARTAALPLSLERDCFVLRERVQGVTLDVKDEDVQTILKMMQRQCGIRNLVIDRDVQGKGTFLFTNVPCRQAFNTVLVSFGLTTSSSYSDNVVAVGRTQ